MNKSFKGAIAAAAAAILLLGGGTTLAYWTATGTVTGGTITAGTLDLINQDCDANWVYAAGSAGAGSTVALWVPGDVVTKSCEFEIEASGDNLSALINAPTTVDLGGTVPVGGTATVAVSYTLDGAALDPAVPITDANDGEKIVATFNVTFPYGTDETPAEADRINANNTQSWAAVLNNITVTLTQSNPNP